VRNTPNRVLAIVVVAIVGVAIVAVVFSATRPVKKLDLGTPAGTVQAYLTAVLDGKNDTAAGYLAPESSCDVQDLDRAFVIHSARVNLVDSQIVGDTALVRVKVEIPSSGPFETYGTEDHSLRLIRVAGRWMLTGIPWPLYDCAVPVKR
jgi:hypothetical protein